MRSYKFIDYVIKKEVFELPNDKDLYNNLVKLSRHDIVEFVLHILQNYSLSKNHIDKRDLGLTIRAMEQWLADPSEENEANAREVAEDFWSPIFGSAIGTIYMPNPAAAAANAIAGMTDAELFKNRNHQGFFSDDERKNYPQNIAKIMSRHEINASSHHASPTNHNINSQEILKFLTSDPHGKNIPYLLDDLEEKGLKPSDQTLRQFGVKNFGTNTEIGKEIIDNNYVDAFYRSIITALSKVK